MHNILNEFHFNNSKNSISLIKKLKDHPIQKQITEILESYKKNQEKDYFKTESNIVYNRRPKGPIYDKNHNLIPYSFVGPANLFSQSSGKRNTKKKTVRMDSNKSISLCTNLNSKSSKYLSRKNIDEKKNQHFHFLNSNALSGIYNEIRNRINKNKNSSEKKNQLADCPKFIKENILNQETILSKFIKFNQQSEKVQKNLLKKTCRNNKEDLLINKSNDFIIKNQINIYREKNEDADIKYRNNLWNITLRNPDINGTYERIGYKNVGSDLDPMYISFNLNHVPEFFVTPGSKGNKGVKIKNLKNLISTGNLEIKGMNLLDFETKKELGFKGKKIYYKPNEIDYLIFKEKKKITSLNEDDKINNFGDKIFAENFNKKDYYDNQSFNNKFTKSFISSNVKEL